MIRTASGVVRVVQGLTDRKDRKDRRDRQDRMTLDNVATGRCRIGGGLELTYSNRMAPVSVVGRSTLRQPADLLLKARDTNGTLVIRVEARDQPSFFAHVTFSTTTHKI